MENKEVDVTKKKE